MRPTNLPSVRSPVVWTRGTPLWTMTVNAGACAAARGTVTAPSRARNARPGLTSEAVVESQRESQGLPGGHRLRHVQAQPSPIDAEAQVGEPAAERREPIGGQSPGPAAHEPRLSRIREDDQVRALEGEERLRGFVLWGRGAIRPVQREVTAVLGLGENHAVARRRRVPANAGSMMSPLQALWRKPYPVSGSDPPIESRCCSGNGSPPIQPPAKTRRFTRPDGLTRV